MNNFKKFVAVLLGVVMACVFATSAFAADFSNADTAAKAKAEIKAFAASYGVTTIDNTVNKLTADQLNVIYANMDSLKAVAANAANTIKGTTDANIALKAANDAVASMNSMLSAAGIVISNPTLDTSDSSQFVVSANVTVNGTTDSGAIARPLSTTTTDNNTSASDAVSNAAQNSAAASSVKTVSSAANPITASSSAVIKATGDNTAVVFAVLLWLLPACSAWPSARSVHCKSSCISPVFDRQRAEPLALPVFRCLYGIGQFILVLDLPFI